MPHSPSGDLEVPDMDIPENINEQLVIAIAGVFCKIMYNEGRWQKIHRKEWVKSMKSSNELRTLLRSVDHKSYPAYKSLAGSYQFGSFVLSIDHVQGDPFASPSSLHVEILHKDAGFLPAYYERLRPASPSRTI